MKMMRLLGHHKGFFRPQLYGTSESQRAQTSPKNSESTPEELRSEIPSAGHDRRKTRNRKSHNRTKKQDDNQKTMQRHKINEELVPPPGLGDLLRVAGL